MICPLTTNFNSGVEILRVHMGSDVPYLNQRYDIMIDQIRAIDNRKLVRKLGNLPGNLIPKIKENIKICLELLED